MSSNKYNRIAGPTVLVYDENGVGYNALEIVQSEVSQSEPYRNAAGEIVRPDPDTFIVWVWPRRLYGTQWDNRGRVFQSGIATQSEADTLARDLVTRTA